MKHKVLIIDTSIMCVWLQVPGMESAGKEGEYDYESVSKHIEEQVKAGATLVLPMTSIIETGNFIARVEQDRKKLGDRMADIIIAAADGTQPWAAFTLQRELWSEEGLKSLANRWRETVVSEKQSIGDASIVDVAQYYAAMEDFEVEIFTGDGGLKNWEYKIAGKKEERRRLRRERK